MTTTSSLDIYQRFEREVRTPRRRLLLDAFLPDADSLPTAVAQPPPLPIPESPAPTISLSERLEAEIPSPPPEPDPKPRKKAASPKRKKLTEKSKSLQEEIEEFMNRDGGALVPSDDFGSNTDPERDTNG